MGTISAVLQRLWKVKVKVAQSCLTLCNLIDYTVHGILHARILEWVVFPFTRASSQSRDRTQVSHIAGGFFYQLSHQGSPRILEWVAYPFSRGSSPPGIESGSPALRADSLPTELPEKTMEATANVPASGSATPTDARSNPTHRVPPTVHHWWVPAGARLSQNPSLCKRHL